MHPFVRAVATTFVVVGVAILYVPVHYRLSQMGLTRIFPIKNTHGLEGITKIPGTYQCEDVHYFGSSNKLYTLCQDPKTRGVYDWAPQLQIFDKPKEIGQGQIVLVDIETLKAEPLELKGFSGPLSPHGFDIWASEADENDVTIAVVNHLPNPDHYEPSPGATPSPNKARSQIEIFKHKVGDKEAVWVRSIRHPLIQTPNDILLAPPNALYVTNDHYYREGLMRGVEDMLTNNTAPWTNVVHVTYTSMPGVAPEEGVEALVALDGIHYANGLGRSAPSRPWEILVTDASGGLVIRADKRDGPQLKIVEQIRADSTIDNPFWFTDWFHSTEPDGTGFVLAGLSKGGFLAHAMKDPARPIPVTVWHIRPQYGPVPSIGYGHIGWTQELIFEDDGHGIKSASASVMISIDPEKNGGKKEGRLFITGFASDAMVAAKIGFTPTKHKD